MPVVLLSFPKHSLGVCHRAGHPGGSFVLSGALGPGDMSFLAPWQRGQSQHDLITCSRARMLRGLPFFWGDAAVPAPSPCPSLLQSSPTLCSGSPFRTGRPLGCCTSWPAQGSEHFLACVSPGTFRGVCKKIDHFPEDADYEQDTAEYLLRESAPLGQIPWAPSPCRALLPVPWCHPAEG